MDQDYISCYSNGMGVRLELSWCKEECNCVISSCTAKLVVQVHTGCNLLNLCNVGKCACWEMQSSWALSVLAGDARVRDPLYPGHFSGLCWQQVTLRDEVISLPRQRAVLLPLTIKTVNILSLVFFPIMQPKETEKEILRMYPQQN